jgi:two-component system response regulator DegU
VKVSKAKPPAAPARSPCRRLCKRRCATGYSTREIGEHLFISEKTVRNHLAALFRKLDARNRTEAVYRGIGLGIVPLP